MEEDLEYVGFWPRVGASIIDTVLMLCITMPLMFAYMGPAYLTDLSLVKGQVGFLVEWLLPAVAVVSFWIARQATPGKMAIHARIVDAESGRPPRTTQLIVRYVGYFVSTIPLFMGLIWVGLDRRKQGWHDKLAGTVVVRRRVTGPEPVRFPGA